jgi:hypothetical protein
MSTYKLTGVLNSADSKSIILGCSDEAMVKLETLRKRMLPSDAKEASSYRNPIADKSVRITFRKDRMKEEYLKNVLVGERVTLWCKTRKYNFSTRRDTKDCSRIKGWVLNLSKIEKSY